MRVPYSILMFNKKIFEVDFFRIKTIATFRAFPRRSGNSKLRTVAIVNLKGDIFVAIL